MKPVLTIFLATLFLLQGCALFNALNPSETKTTPLGKSRPHDLVVTPADTNIVLEWGTPKQISLDVSWAKGQTLSVQLAPAASTPDWLTAELQPAIVNPPSKTTLMLTADVGVAKLGPGMLILEASGYGMTEPVTIEIPFTVMRKSGPFAPVLAGDQTIECNNVCGQVKDNVVTFYDVLKEKGQECSASAVLPLSQRIGPKGFAMSPKGFGYGRTCQVVVVYEANRSISFINLGITPRLARGAILLNLLGVGDCWLSPDNTVAIVAVSGLVVPYDVVTSAELGTPCQLPGPLPGGSLSGDTLRVGPCSWKI